jgi:hypothetical protein
VIAKGELGREALWPNSWHWTMTELGAEIERKMKEYSLLCNESETLLRLARCRAHKMSREEVLNWLGVIYELLKRYSTLMQELEALDGSFSGR